RRVVDEGAGGAFGPEELGAADPETAGGVCLERVVTQVVEAAAPLDEPWGVMLGQQPPLRDELSAQRRTPRPPPLTLSDRGLRLVDRGERVLDVDPRVRG
ncbi:MAG: hypothetical protein JOY58_10830, partial [Solirubrobacterales bacterium]|nr:hypothetical protein [Solirubrobacterales bacterium]